MEQREITARSIHTGEQYVPALCERVPGTTKATCLYGNIVEGLTAIEIDIRDHDHASKLTYAGEDYPLNRLWTKFRHIAEAKGLGSVPYEIARRFIPDLQLPEEVNGPDVSDGPVSEGFAPGFEERCGKTAPSVVGRVCKELGIEPSVARRTLRAAGMHAPYTDEKAIRQALKETK